MATVLRDRPRTKAPGSVPAAHAVGAVTRRSRTRIAAGGLLVVASTLAFVLLYNGAGGRRAVLAMAAPVGAGETIEAADLAEVRVSVDPGLNPVPSTQRGSVVGRVAGVSLVPGTLLTPAQLADGPALTPGNALVGAVLKPGQFPVGLRVGDQVRVVSVGGGDPESAGSLGEATVAAVEPSADAGGSTALSLLVPTDKADGVATDGGAGRLSLVVVGTR